MYAPVTNNLSVAFTYMSDNTLLEFIHGDANKANILDLADTIEKEPPNLIIILNESFGNLQFQTKEGLKHSPFFRETVLKDKDFYWFSKGRAISGMTDSATPGIILGSVIAADTDANSTKTYFQHPNIINILKQLNYTVILYCSYETEFHGNRWMHMNEMFAQYDLVISRTTLHAKAVNEFGMDDRKLTKILIKDLFEKYGQKKFFITIIWNNLHYPFLTDASYVENPKATKSEQEQARYINSLGITDDMTQQIFNTLDELQILEKTIVAFSSDHGETPGEIFRRSIWLQSPVLRVPLWFHISQRYTHMRNIDTTNLRNNSDKIISNLDIFPTLLDALQLQVALNNSEDDPILRGSSLFKPISKMRMIVGWQGKPYFDDCISSQAYVANETHIVFYRAQKNRIQMEVLDNDEKIKAKIDWSDIPNSEKNKWIEILKNKYPFIHDQLYKCGFQLF